LLFLLLSLFSVCFCFCCRRRCFCSCVRFGYIIAEAAVGQTVGACVVWSNSLPGDFKDAIDLWLHAYQFLLQERCNACDANNNCKLRIATNHSQHPMGPYVQPASSTLS
jgi:hypothetical protein